MEVRACPVCNGPIKRNKNVTCSRSCANSFFRRGAYNGRHRQGEDNYRTICFLHHEKKCIICGEDKIVEIHHWDHNHNNNDPSNLIPICSTHHKYLHSRYKGLIEGRVNDYREQFLESTIRELAETFEEDLGDNDWNLITERS